MNVAVASHRGYNPVNGDESQSSYLPIPSGGYGGSSTRQGAGRPIRSIYEKVRNIGVTGSSRRAYPQFTGVTAGQVIPDEAVPAQFPRGKGRDRASVDRNLGGAGVNDSIRHSTADLGPNISVNLTRDSQGIARSFTRERSSMPAEQQAELYKEMHDMIKVEDETLAGQSVS